MTIQELANKTKKIAKDFDDIMFSHFETLEDNNTPTLQGISARYPNIAGRKWNPTSTYNKGDIVSYGVNIFISLINNQKGNNPISVTSAWKEITIKNLQQGFFYVSAMARLQYLGSGSGIVDVNALSITNQWNIQSLINYGNGLYKLTFSPQAGLINADYLVFTCDGGLYYSSGIKFQVRHFANVIQKHRDYIFFKVPALTIKSPALKFVILTSNQ